MQEPNWQALSEQTDFRVLTLPTGETVSSDQIIGVVHGEAQQDPALRIDIARRVIIETKGRRHYICYDEPDAVFKAATTAHRQYGGR